MYAGLIQQQIPEHLKQEYFYKIKAQTIQISYNLVTKTVKTWYQLNNCLQIQIRLSSHTQYRY
jgi:hypothetical protein